MEPGAADRVNRSMLRVQSLLPGPGLLPTAPEPGPREPGQERKARIHAGSVHLGAGIPGSLAAAKG